MEEETVTKEYERFIGRLSESTGPCFLRSLSRRQGVHRWHDWEKLFEQGALGKQCAQRNEEVLRSFENETIQEDLQKGRLSVSELLEFSALEADEMFLVFLRTRRTEQKECAQ